MKLFHIILFCFLIFKAATVVAEPVGIVKSVSGEAYLETENSRIRAVPHMRISPGDHIYTSKQSSIGLIFEDDTVVSLGPDSSLIIQAFIFNPAEEELSFVARMVKGTFSFITGQIAKLAPKKVKLETPDATLGVRGTKFVVKVEG